MDINTIIKAIVDLLNKVFEVLGLNYALGITPDAE